MPNPFAWQRLKRLEESVTVSERTAEQAERYYTLAHQRQVTERFARALELLADEKHQVRLGGIYALERLMRDSASNQSAIVEVMATYVREHARPDDHDPHDGPTSEVQAILTILGRRAWSVEREDKPLDLHGTSLGRVHLPFANFQRAFLYQCNLEGAMLLGARLQGAWLSQSNLARTNFDDARLEGADLRDSTGLTRDQLATAHLDAATQLPQYLRAETLELKVDLSRFSAGE